MRNVGWQPISFDLDKNQLSAGGFKVEPDKVVRLPGLPESESVDFTVNFTSKGKLPQGEFRYKAKLDMKAGPPVMLLFRANITVPDLTLSADTLDFGNVQVGMTRSMSLIVHNPKEIPAEWKVTKPLEQAKDWGFFTCDPPEGTLPSGKSITVQVTFQPTSERLFTVKIPFKVTNNPRSNSLTVKGIGKELQLRVEPPALELPPTMPHADVVTADFQLVNPTDYPIEVYSIEFDEQYLAEEEMLRSADGGDVLVLPPRAPGDALWDEVVTAHQEKLDREAANFPFDENSVLRGYIYEPPPTLEVNLLSGVPPSANATR